MAASGEIPLATVEDLIERAVVRLSRSPNRERALLSGAGQAWPQDLLDGAASIRNAFLQGKADTKALGLRGSDWDDIHRVPDEPDRPRKVARRITDDDMLMALSWVAALGRKRDKPRRRRRRGSADEPQDFEARLVWWVALGFTFEQIGRRGNMHANTAERRYREAIIDCWRIANGYLKVEGAPPAGRA